MYIIAISKCGGAFDDKMYISNYNEFLKVCTNTEVYDYFLYNSNNELIDQLVTY